MQGIENWCNITVVAAILKRERDNNLSHSIYLSLFHLYLASDTKNENIYTI